MNIVDLKKLESYPNLPFSIKSSKLNKQGNLVINNRIAIPIEGYASYYKTDSDISILNSNGKEIGLLCFTKELGEITPNQLTESQFVAFLTEAEYENKDEIYKFSKNYIVISYSFYAEYRKEHLKTSALWGGFYHNTPDVDTVTYSKVVSEIKITKVDLISQIYHENIIRAILQPYAFERYLKYYHLLELRFDIDVVKKIKALDLDLELSKIGELLNEYHTREIDRLHDILYSNCADYLALVPFLDKVNSHKQIAIDLFFKFGSGKDGNPLKNQENIFADVVYFRLDERSLQSNGVNFNRNHRKFLLDLVAYWIYRIRCSIAHNKIGEYILAKDQEDFLVEFAEPLILEVLRQCFKKIK